VGRAKCPKHQFLQLFCAASNLTIVDSGVKVQAAEKGSCPSLLL
jgi:hypothetical protein